MSLTTTEISMVAFLKRVASQVDEHGAFVHAHLKHAIRRLEEDKPPLRTPWDDIPNVVKERIEKVKKGE